MDALVAMLVQPAPGSATLQAEAAAAAAKLLCALLCADVLAVGEDFCRAGGMSALRALVSNAPVAPAVCADRTAHPSRGAVVAWVGSVWRAQCSPAHVSLDTTAKRQTQGSVGLEKLLELEVCTGPLPHP